MRVYIFLILLLTISTWGYSQCPSKGITTNPDAPVNPERPTRTNLYFDWRTQFYQVNSSKIAASQIEGPFYQGYQNSNVIQLFTNKNMNPADGWELIKYDMGYYKINIAQNPPIDYVYVILYNKLTGVLRVFLAGDGPPFNGAKIQLKFVGKPDTERYSSILSNASTIFALDKFESNPSIVGVTSYLNGLGKWFYADFQMTYDPCTCFYESLLQVEVKLINEASISLEGSLAGTITSISQNTGSVSESGYSVKDVIAAGMKAQKSFKSISEFTSEQEKAFNIAGKTNAELTIEQLTKRNQLNEFQNAIKSSGFFKAGLKAAPYVAAAFELVDFFSGGGRSGPSQVEIMPMAINATIKLKGDLVANYRYRDIFFYTPGSKNAHLKDTSLYAYYNEALGVFNLLTTPRVYYTKSEVVNGLTRVVTMTRNYQLLDQIEYTINPAAGFSEVEIMGSIVLKDSNTKEITFQTGFLPINTLTQFSINSLIRKSCPGGVCPITFDLPELKLLVNLGRGPNEQNVVFVASYQLDSNLAPNGFSFDQDVYRYIDDSNLQSDKTFGGQYWNSDLNAYKSVTLSTGAVLYPTSTARTFNSGISNFSSYSTFLAAALSARVYDFCTTGSYSSNLSRNARIEQITNSEDKKDEFLDKSFLGFPNPASGKVSFRYYINEPSQVQLNLISTTGSVVATPVNEYQEAGPYEVSYDASNLPAGIYIYTLETSKGKETKRLVIIK